MVEILQSVQFVTVKGQRLAILDAEDWEKLVAWLENLEDLEIAKQAYMALKDADGDRDAAGWLKWDEVKGEL